MCTDLLKTETIKTIKFSTCKILLYILLNLITAFLINLFIYWFPKLKLIFLYSECRVTEAKYVAIYGTGKL